MFWPISFRLWKPSFWWVCLAGLWGFVLEPSTASAQDRRLALLVVNQRGWKNDPPLRYALQGDLIPLGATLRRLGFEVIEVINQPPQVLRQKLDRLHRRFQTAPPTEAISTFLFYYSGHADPQALHMGPQTSQDLTYSEFAQRFRSLPVKRRFAIFDACFSGEIIRHFGSLHRYKELLKEGRMKGVKRRSAIDISQLSYPNQGEEEGFRIIASSVQVSWELDRYRASVFTYHLLRGLRGDADLDKDGKISVDELFDFTSRAVERITHQKPQQLVVTQRDKPYALAPAYRSRLRIGAEVVGDLQVSVANFVWSYTKSSRSALTVAAIEGKATVRLKQGGTCLHQEVSLPKGGEIRLPPHWQKRLCQEESPAFGKGSLFLPAEVEFQDESEEPHRSFGVWGGLASQGEGGLSGFQPTLGLDFRWRFLQIGALVAQSVLPDRSFSLTRTSLQGGIGYPLWLHLPGFQAEIWLGAFAQGGVVWQHFSDSSGSFHVHAAFGGLASLTWWHRTWGLRLHTSVGGDHLPIVGGQGWSWVWNLGLGVTWGV